MLYPTLGLIGGTFDPIHFGHLRMALECQAAFDLHQVKFIPCYQPMHKTEPVADASSRLHMVELAIQDESFFVSDDCEIKRAVPTYTIDTLRELRLQNPDTSLCLLLGIDAFLGLESWREKDALLDYCHIIVADRPEFSLPEFGYLHSLVKQHVQKDHLFIRKNLNGGIFFQDITALRVSATRIRHQVENGLNPRYLLPDSVLQYIHQQHLYREKKD